MSKRNYFINRLTTFTWLEEQTQVIMDMRIVGIKKRIKQLTQKKGEARIK